MATDWANMFGFRCPLIIDAERVTKSYNHPSGMVTALRDVSLKIRPGTLTVIVGPSGSGKTTLLHVLAGLIRPDSGSVLFHGLDLVKAEDDVLRIIREEFISIAYQEQSLVRYITVEENVQLPLAMMGISEDERRKASDKALARLGLEERKGHRAEEISGGERQITNMARAMAKNPILVLADEPTANLDHEKIDLLMKTILEEIRTRGSTFVIATHDPLLARHADTVLEIRDGVVRVSDEGRAIRVWVHPERYMNPQIFEMVRDEIHQVLVGEELTNGQVTEALGTPFTVTRVDTISDRKGEGEEPGGIVDSETLIELDTSLKELKEPDEERELLLPLETRAEESNEILAGDIIRQSVLKARRPNIQYWFLKWTTILSGTVLATTSVAVWLRLGIWSALSTAFLAVAGIFFLLPILYAPREQTGHRRPTGGRKYAGAPGMAGWTAVKNRLCDFCGAGWAGEFCHTCGRRMCEKCWPPVIREPTFCKDHLHCPICGRSRIHGQPYTAVCSPSTFCGDYVCSECFLDGVCLECAMEGKGLTKEVGRAEEELRTLILEPVPDLSDQICARLGPALGQELVGQEITQGRGLEARGVELRTAAVLPIEGGIVGLGTHVHVTNRRERDARLRELREKSEFFVCYYEGCDYLVGSFCCVCLRPVCVNHSTRCTTCGCPVCEDHILDGECTRCRPRPIATTRWGSIKEILDPIKIPALAIVTLLIFGRVMLYGEQLRSIHPSLPMIVITLYFGLQVPAAVFFAWRSKRKKPSDGSSEGES